jgi:uncharacterized protein (DUF697 family)
VTMSEHDDKPSTPVEAEPVLAEAVIAEAIPSRPSDRWQYLGDNRGVIVRRALLATALGGALPIPVLDDYFATRIRAGMFMKLAQNRGVGLPAAAAEVIAEAKGTSTLRNLGTTAATLIALKLAWRKFFTLLAAGRGAEEAATTYQAGLLFDHYCARLHTGPAIDRTLAAMLRRTIHGSAGAAGKEALVAIFKDGGKTLGRSLLQAPGWVNRKMSTLLERWVRSRGNPEALQDDDSELSGDDARWLDRAAELVDARLLALGNEYLDTLIGRFEKEWRSLQTARAGASPGSPGGDHRD